MTLPNEQMRQMNNEQMNLAVQQCSNALSIEHCPLNIASKGGV